MRHHESSLTSSDVAFLLLPILWLVLANSGPIQWSDSGHLIREAAHGPLFSTGLGALSHPTYYTLTVATHRVFGAMGVAWLNPVLAVPTAWLMFRLARSIGLTTHWASMAVASGLLAHGCFWVNTHVEVYGLHLLLVLAAHWVCLDGALAWSQRRRALALGLLTGLAVTTHQLSFVVLLPLYILMLTRMGLRLAWVLPGVSAGLALAYPGLLNELASGKTVFQVIRQYLTGHGAGPSGEWEGALGRFDLMWRDKVYVAIWAASLLGIPAIGLWPRRLTAAQSVLWGAAVLNALFAMSYAVSDRYTFFMPGAALLALLGCARLQDIAQGRSAPWVWTARVATLAGPVLLTSAWALTHAGVIKLPARDAVVPQRDDVKYFLAPYVPDHSAAEFVAHQLQHTPETALILADHTPFGALISAQTAGTLPLRRTQRCDFLNGRPLPDGPVFLVRETYCEQILAEHPWQRSPAGWVLRRP